ncbi:MAG: MFS transporter [Acidobacteriota bacterium]|nr:MFS transporter [Acidobacteriota bacterium]
MARRVEIPVAYLAGLAQGFALVTVPAASDLLTSPRGYAFTGVEYGALFVPMVAAAIAASAAGGVLALRWGLKRLFLIGVLLDVLAMALVALSAAFIGQHVPSYATLIVGMLALGGGFGSTLAALNSLAPGFFPDHAESALTALHTLLGTGTALAPLFVSAASGRGWWWIPALVAAVLFLLAIAGSTQSLHIEEPKPSLPAGGPFAFLRGLSRRLWAFLAVVALYGISETLCGNWAILYLHGERGLSARMAGLALAAFWAMVTLGRLAIAVASVWLPPRWIYRALPLLLLVSFLVVPLARTPAAAIAAFGFAGLACSAFLPLSVSFTEEQFPRLAELMAGELMAAYMIGYGIASFAVGPLVDSGAMRLASIYSGASVVAAVMIVMSFFLTRGART